jgi:hypothetical protein
VALSPDYQYGAAFVPTPAESNADFADDRGFHAIRCNLGVSIRVIKLVRTALTPPAPKSAPRRCNAKNGRGTLASGAVPSLPRLGHGSASVSSDVGRFHSNPAGAEFVGDSGPIS